MAEKRVAVLSATVGTGPLTNDTPVSTESRHLATAQTVISTPGEMTVNSNNRRKRTFQVSHTLSGMTRKLARHFSNEPEVEVSDGRRRQNSVSVMEYLFPSGERHGTNALILEEPHTSKFGEGADEQRNLSPTGPVTLPVPLANMSASVTRSWKPANRRALIAVSSLFFN